MLAHVYTCMYTHTCRALPSIINRAALCWYIHVPIVCNILKYILTHGQKLLVSYGLMDLRRVLMF